MSNQTIERSLEQERVNALCRWYKAENKIVWLNAKRYTAEVSIDTQELRKEFKKRVERMNLNWDEYCSVCEKLGFQV